MEKVYFGIGVHLKKDGKFESKYSLEHILFANVQAAQEYCIVKGNKKVDKIYSVKKLTHVNSFTFTPVFNSAKEALEYEANQKSDSLSK